MSENIQLLNYMRNIQPSAKKKVKRLTYNDLLLYLNDTELSEGDVDILFSGNESLKIIGILELCGKKNSGGEFKKSAFELLKIVHDILIFSKQSERYSKEFVLYDDYIKAMSLSDHYKESKHTKDKEYKNRVIHILKTIKIIRPQFSFDNVLEKSAFKEIMEEVEKLIAKFQSEKTKNTNIYQEVMNEIKETVNLEPKTWDDVLKLKNKKLLTTEFISFNTNSRETGTFIDEDKEAEKELINNFIDPLTRDNRKLNILDFTEEERSKLHLQYETFDSVFFLEKFYFGASLNQFQQALVYLETNLQQVSKDDENLVDNNIYKYLDCKKILDEILSRFKSTTSKNFNLFRENLFELQNKIKLLLDPIKQKHENYKLSKSAMDIIQKFQKYFSLKEKIEHCLKFSNFEELAELLKKINFEIKEISQTKFIYGEFYEFFVKTIENFKKVLNNIISQSSVREIIEKHFKLLLDFDIEVEAVDDILNTLKEKMSNKIENYLEFTDNFEIKNFKEFFCDEFHVEILSDKIFSLVIKEADQYLRTNKNPFSKMHLNLGNKEKIDDFTIKKIGNNALDFNITNAMSGNILRLNKNRNVGNNSGNNSGNNKFSTNLNNEVTELNYNVNDETKKKNLINVENIIQSLYEDIKEFLIMMKTLDDAITLKINRKNYTGASQIKSIFQEIYHYLFDKLNSFLFTDNNDMQKNFIENYSRAIIKIEENKDLKFNDLDPSFDSAMKLIDYYDNNLEISLVRFNDNFNKNTLQNTSNLLLNIFDLFEIYIHKESLDALYDPRKVIIEKIFFAFLNEKIIMLLNYFINENSINSRDTALTINNSCGFTFTKNFLLMLFKSFKNIKKFYINILKKSNEGVVKYDIVYLSFFAVLKCFYLRFVHFYKTEFECTENYQLLNALILEILKNFVFLKNEILIIVKSLFKNMDSDLLYKINDLNQLGNNLQNLFSDQFIKNEAIILFNLFISTFDNSKSFVNFYEKYDDLLVSVEYQDANNLFMDIRSVVVEIIFHNANLIKEFYELDLDFLDNKEYGNTKTEKIKSLINFSLFHFFNKVIDFVLENKNTWIKDRKIILIYQFYFEILFINLFLEDIINIKPDTSFKYKSFLSIIIDVIIEYKIQNKIFLEAPSSKDENSIFSKEELMRKKNILDEYKSKYFKYTNCFKI